MYRELNFEAQANRFRDLVEAVPAVIYEAEPGPEGRWHYVSPQLEGLLGDTPAEWLADPTCFTRRLHPDDREAVFHMESRAFVIAEDDLTTCVGEYRMLHRDGHMIWVRDEARVGVPREGAGSRTPFWRGVLVDITEERATRQLLIETYKHHRGELGTNGHPPASEAGDVFRITCSSCGAIHAADGEIERCGECGSDAVLTDSMAGLEQQLVCERGDLDNLLDGIHLHLQRLGTSLHPADDGYGPRFATRRHGAGELSSLLRAG
jgi:PAS domain S-box-containing protein